MMRSVRAVKEIQSTRVQPDVASEWCWSKRVQSDVPVIGLVREMVVQSDVASGLV